MAFWADTLVMLPKSFSIFVLPPQGCAVIPLTSAFRIPAYRLRRLLRFKVLMADNALFNQNLHPLWEEGRLPPLQGNQDGLCDNYSVFLAFLCVNGFFRHPAGVTTHDSTTYVQDHPDRYLAV